MIYNSIETYKDIVDNDESFLAKESYEKTELVLNKHTKPLDYLVSELVTDNSDENRISDDILYINNLNDFCVKLAKKDKVPSKDIFKVSIFDCSTSIFFYFYHLIFLLH